MKNFIFFNAIISLSLIITIIIFPNFAYGIDIAVGTSPFQVAVDPTNNKVYVANQGSNTVSVIDGASGSPTENTVIDTINVGLGPVSIVVNPTNNKVYVANQGDNTVSVIDGMPGSPTENTVIATITTGSGPVGVDVDSTTNRVYVGNIFSGTLSIIDGTLGSPTENTVINTIFLGPGASRLAVDSDLKKVYVVNFLSNTTFVVDVLSGSPTENTLVATITVGNAPAEAEVDLTTNKVYVTNRASNSVSVIDGLTNAVTDTIPVGDAPNGIGIDSNINRLYVNNFNSNTVSVIDTSTDTVIATVTVGLNPSGLGVDTSTNKVYIANRGSNTVTILDVGGNLPPTADAGPNQRVVEGTQVTLDGTGSSDPNGDPLSFSWTQTSGPTITLSSSSSTNPTFTAPQVDSRTLLSFDLVVNDGTFSSVPDTVNIIVDDIFAFDVLLSQVGNDLTGSVNVGDLTADKTIAFNFVTPITLENGELQQTIVTTAVPGNGVEFDFTVRSDVPQTLPPLPTDPAIFFDIEFQGGIDFSNTANLPSDKLPKSRFLVDKDFVSENIFSDGCPVVTFFLLDENTNKWEQIGNPLETITNKIYVVNSFSNTVSVIDGSTNIVIKSIPVGIGPFSIHFDNNTNKVYVLNSVSNTVSVIDVLSDTVVSTIPVGNTPSALDVNPDNDQVYVANRGSNTVSVIDGTPGSPTENTVIDTIPVGNGPTAVRIDTNTNRIFVSNFFDTTVSVIDGTPGSPTENQIIDTISVSNFPGGFIIDPRDSRVYLSIFGSNIISVIDGTPGSPTENQIIDTITIGNSPAGGALDISTNTLYFANTVDDNISVVDLSIKAEISKIPVGDGPFNISINTNTNRLYVANSNSHTVSIIDIFPGSPTENTVIDTVPVGIAPFDSDLIPDVPNPVRDPSADVIDSGTGDILQCAYIGDQPHLSKFAVGGIVKALFIGGSGGGASAPISSLSSFISNENFDMPDEIRTIVENHNPLVPIKPMDPNKFEGFDFPLTINYNPYNGYPLGGYENILETNFIKVGTPTTLTFTFYEDTEIQHFSFYTNLYGILTKIHQSDTQFLYNKDKPIEIIDPYDSYDDVSIFVKELNETKKQVVLKFTPIKPTEVNDFIVRVWDPRLHSMDMIVRDAYQIVSDEESIFEDSIPKPEVETIKTKYVPIWIKNNAGWWSEELLDDSDFIAGIEYLVQKEIIIISKNGKISTSPSDEVPSWIKNNAGWWSEDLVSEQEFLDSIQWLISNGVINIKNN